MNRKGFTLVEVIVILAVIAILAAVAVPMALRIFQVTAEETTREEMDNLKKAMLGDSRKLQSSFRSDFGFVGDLGCMPTAAFGGPALERLLTQGSYLGWSFDGTKQAGAGWKGPYITGATVGQETEEFTKDQWGNNYTYTVPGGACPLTATLTSNGPDGNPGADDITISIGANETTATVRGTVKDITGARFQGMPVELYYPLNGAVNTATFTTDVNGDYSFSAVPVPFGQRAVRAIPPARLFLVPGTVTVQDADSDGQQEIVFKIINYSGTAITITTMAVSWNPTGGSYDDILINQTNVDGTGGGQRNYTSGTTVNITDTPVAANPTPPSSMRVVIDSPDTQLPDIKIDAGTIATIELWDFSQAMSGRTVTVTFNHAGGPSTVQFVP